MLKSEIRFGGLIYIRDDMGFITCLPERIYDEHDLIDMRSISNTFVDYYSKTSNQIFRSEEHYKLFKIRMEDKYNG